MASGQALIAGLLRIVLIVSCVRSVCAQVSLPLPLPVRRAPAPQTQTPLNTNPPQDLLRLSVPQEALTPGVLQLTLKGALDRAVRFNAGLITENQSTRIAQATRLFALSRLLPSVRGGVSESILQVNLEAFGISGSIVGASSIIGPFSVFDARAYLTQTILDLSAVAALKSGTQNVRSAEFSAQDARQMVVQLVQTLYLQAVAASSRIESVDSQVNTAAALHRLAADQQAAGVATRIDAIRAQVELQTRRQQLLAARNDFEQQKLVLSRVIGLPLGQPFVLADDVPYKPDQLPTLEDALAKAYNSRADLRSAEAAERAAEYDRKAAAAQRYPTLAFDGNYGALGRTPGSSRATFIAGFGLSFPIFEGGKIRADVERADAVLRQRRADTANVRGTIDYDVRTAFLDLQSTSEQVAVARSTIALAGEELQHAQNRFRAGVTNNVEVTQAQQSIAHANDNYIASLFQYNQAKAGLARSFGYSDEESLRFLGVKTK